MKRMFLRTAFNYDMAKASRESAYSSTEKGKTLQSQKDEADVNRIVRRIQQTGMTQQPTQLPTYQWFEDIFDFQTAQNALVQANKAFATVRSDIRARFENDPQKFVEFCSKKENLDALREMGLAPPAPKVDIPVAVVTK